MERIFATYITDKLLFIVPKLLFQINQNTLNKRKRQEITIVEIQMTNKYVKSCLSSLVINTECKLK